MAVEEVARVGLGFRLLVVEISCGSCLRASVVGPMRAMPSQRFRWPSIEHCTAFNLCCADHTSHVNLALS